MDADCNIMPCCNWLKLSLFMSAILTDVKEGLSLFQILPADIACPKSISVIPIPIQV